MAGAVFSKLSTNLKVTITTSPTKIPSDPTELRGAIIFKNVSGQTIYVGGSDSVTVASGYPLAVGEPFPFDMAGGDIYARTASGTSDVRILEAL